MFLIYLGTIISDDFPTYHQREKHRRTKREIVYDDFSEFSTEKLETYSRPARDLSRLYSSSFSDDFIERKHSESDEYYIEILIVVDKVMYEHHRTSDDLIHYILTLMSHVSFFIFIMFRKIMGIK